VRLEPDEALAASVGSRSKPTEPSGRRAETASKAAAVMAMQNMSGMFK
jgi:hypothetical protein